MTITKVSTPARISRMLSKIKGDGIDKESAYSYIGECMEEDDKIFTLGDVSSAMNAVYNKVLKALEDDPKAKEKVEKYFQK